MSLFAEYLKERTSVQIIEKETGFITYSIVGEECYIQDLYVVPQFRKQHIATSFADEVEDVARREGCKILAGSVSPQAKNATESLKVLIAYGMTLHSSTENLIIFKKEIF